MAPIVALVAFSRIGDIPAVHSSIFPLLVWAAMRFDVRGSAFVVAEVAVVAALSNIYSAGAAQAQIGPESQVLATQTFLVMAFISTYILAVLLVERKRVEEMLAEQRSKAIASAKLATLGEMAGGIAHEINNPLAIIQGRAQQLRMILSREPIDVARANANSQSIEQTVQRIASIIRGLRAFARDGDNDPRSIVGVNDIVNDALSFCREKCKSSGVQLLVPEQNLNLKIECRPMQIVQAVLNLLSNAIHAALLAPDPWVRLEVLESVSEIQFLVSNSGPPIPDSLREKIFQPFFTTKAVGEGTGLGLSISKGIVEQNRGTLILECDRPVTTFTIAFPKSKLLEIGVTRTMFQ